MMLEAKAGRCAIAVVPHMYVDAVITCNQYIVLNKPANLTGTCDESSLRPADVVRG